MMQESKFEPFRERRSLHRNYDSPPRNDDHLSALLPDLEWTISRTLTRVTQSRLVSTNCLNESADLLLILSNTLGIRAKDGYFKCALGRYLNQKLVCSSGITWIAPDHLSWIKLLGRLVPHMLYLSRHCLRLRERSPPRHLRGILQNRNWGEVETWAIGHVRMAWTS